MQQLKHIFHWQQLKEQKLQDINVTCIATYMHNNLTRILMMIYKQNAGTCCN